MSKSLKEQLFGKRANICKSCARQNCRCKNRKAIDCLAYKRKAEAKEELGL